MAPFKYILTRPTLNEQLPKFAVLLQKFDHIPLERMEYI